MLFAHTICRLRFNAALLVGSLCTSLIVCAAIPAQAQFSFTDLYDFGNCGVDFGCQPLNYGQLVQWSDGNLYGTTTAGGMHAYGTAFALSTSGTYYDEWEFDGVSGSYPNAGLTLASDGNFYGTTLQGGAYNQGIVFCLTPRTSINSSSLTVIHSFNGTDGGQPFMAPIQGKDGNLYGVTSYGTTYTILLPTQTFKQLSQTVPGAPYGPLLLASDGNLYGATATGGTSNVGTVFRMTTPGGAIKIIHNFNGTDGSWPGPLTQASDGNLYGAAQYGGANNIGSIFKMTLAGKVLATLSFDAPTGLANIDGLEPINGLLAASDGYLYGANQAGGANGAGAIYQLSTGMAFHKLLDFTGTTGPVAGQGPTATLMQAANGDLYGLTYFGGANSKGDLFQLSAINFREILTVEGPIFVKPGTPVQFIGQNLTHVIQLQFGGLVQAQFQATSDNLLSATVPFGASDGVATAIYDTGLMASTNSGLHMLPTITGFDPPSGPVGTQVTIVGGGFTGTKKVTFGGVSTGNFVVVSPSQIQATVPSGAKTGKIAVTTPNGNVSSTQKFTVN